MNTCKHTVAYKMFYKYWRWGCPKSTHKAERWTAPKMDLMLGKMQYLYKLFATSATPETTNKEHLICYLIC